MATYTGTVDSPRAIGDVFDYMADFSNASEWDPASVESEALNGATPKPGARYRIVSRFLGSETELVYEIVELDRPRRVVLRAENESVTSVDEISFEQASEGTRLTYHADLSLKGARRVLDPVLGVAFKRLCERARARMSEVLSR